MLNEPVSAIEIILWLTRSWFVPILRPIVSGCLTADVIWNSFSDRLLQTSFLCCTAVTVNKESGYLLYHSFLPESALFVCNDVYHGSEFLICVLYIRVHQTSYFI